ncbi:hypothetical protein G7081_01200 [Vagococcus coleopterorum]|uniref:Pilus assembly protein, PilO n=1 Tax=Vagococcus coleopterorum TaxID=2714946 RepID=A0A6G8AL54_9ENTE|nr:hypothetical protein [Vagococcus coleopterorum]QIL45801.1 hypothetical protein G7081_01200 [Vagococcus coleopterorum]
MNKVIFTKKHLVAAGVAGIVLVVLIIASWFLMIAPKSTQIQHKATELKKTNEEIQLVEAELDKLKENPDLLNSEVIKVAPVITNGVQLEAYFKDLENIDKSLDISVQKIQFEHELLYPQEPNAEKQLQKSKVGFDIIGDSAKDIISFVDQLEQGKRFMKIVDITYRASSTEDSDSTYSATVVAEMYYLSHYETGKPVADEK